MALFGFGYKKKLDDLKHYLDEENYDAALKVANTIQVQKVKSAYELNLLGKAYKKAREFQQAKELFELSYEMRCSRTVLLDVMDCCLETKDLEGAEKYFDEYHRVAPEDRITQYMYRYRMEKKKGRDRRLLITILEELKALEYIEEYAYELAKQYHKAGMVQECMDECNDIILWFAFGPTVERAKALLAYYRGEISLEEIKAASARYQEELERQWREEKEKQAEEAAAGEDASEAAGEEQEETAEEAGSTEEEIVCSEEPEEDMEEYIEETEDAEYMDEEEAPEEEETEDTDAEEEFELPEIDMTGISFDDMAETEVFRESNEENVRHEEELYVPSADAIGTSNERLADMIAKSGVSIPEILNNFGRIERIQKQVVKSLELVLSDRDKAYFVITGETQTGKTTLALYMIRLLYELGMVKYDRTATIDAVQLNQVSIEDYGEELKNCNLIIENAGGMTKESIDGLLRFSKGSKGKTCVILEDSIRNINKFLRAREELNRLFNNRIHLGKYNTEDLMGFAYDYIKKEDYGIDKMAAHILYDKIDEVVREYGNDQRLIRTLKLVEVVMARAEKRTGELLLEMATEGKIQQGNYLVIIPDDVTP